MMAKLKDNKWANLRPDDLKRRIERVLSFCEPHLNEMWAARIVSILLASDFRETRECLKDYKDVYVKPNDWPRE